MFTTYCSLMHVYCSNERQKQGFDNWILHPQNWLRHINLSQNNWFVGIYHYQLKSKLAHKSLEQFHDCSRHLCNSENLSRFPEEWSGNMLKFYSVKNILWTEFQITKSWWSSSWFQTNLRSILSQDFFKSALFMHFSGLEKSHYFEIVSPRKCHIRAILKLARINVHRYYMFPNIFDPAFKAFLKM